MPSFFRVNASARQGRWRRTWLVIAADATIAEAAWRQIYQDRWCRADDDHMAVQPAPELGANEALVISAGTCSTIVVNQSSATVFEAPDNGCTTQPPANTQVELLDSTCPIRQTQDLLTRAHQLLTQAPLSDAVGRMLATRLAELLAINHTRLP